MKDKKREKKKPTKENALEVLYEDPNGDFTITVQDVELAIEEGEQRMGPEFAERLIGPLEEETEENGER